KKKLSAILFFFFLISSIFSQQTETSTEQLTTPKDIYVGDEVHIHYNFRSPYDLFDIEKNNENIEIPLDKDFPTFYEKSSLCTIKEVSLKRFDEVNYILNIVLVPWKTGVIDFERFNLHDLFQSSGIQSNISFPIDIMPIEILSLSEKNHITILQPPTAPILVAGTTYFVYGLIILCCIFIALICITLTHVSSVISFLKHLKAVLGYGKNAYTAVKRLRRLEHDTECSDADFSKEIQVITRNYLSYRYSTPFNNYDTFEIEKSFDILAKHSVHFAQKMRLQELLSMFHRTDYIRYATNSLESKLLPPSLHETILLDGEREALSMTVKKAISYFERHPIKSNNPSSETSELKENINA
nr:hypothetical protein [Treponema sp.]